MSDLEIPQGVTRQVAFALACRELWDPAMRGKRRCWHQLSEAVRESYYRRAGELIALALKEWGATVETRRLDRAGQVLDPHDTLWLEGDRRERRMATSWVRVGGERDA